MITRTNITRFIRKYGGVFYPLLQKINHAKKVRSIKKNEKIVSWGNDYPDKIFYVIWRKGEKEGIFSYVNSFMTWIDYAVEQEYIPVIDMMNHPNPYLDKDLLGKENSYEYFFKQPYGYTMEDIKNAKNVIISTGEPGPYRILNEDDEMIEYWHRKFQQYVIFNEEVVSRIKDQYNKLFCKGDVVLGVNVRGTGYLNLASPGIPIQPDNQEVIELAKKWLVRYKCNKLFLAVDSTEAYELFKKEFGDILMVNERKFYEHGGDEVDYKKGEHFDRGAEYITTVALLSQCDYLLGGLSGSFYTAQLMKPINENYKNIYLFHMGKWTPEMLKEKGLWKYKKEEKI